MAEPIDASQSSDPVASFILKESPFIRKFSPVCVTINNGKPLFSSCVNCGKFGTLQANLKRCTRCVSVAYCGRECQKQDYKSHKTFCKVIDEEQKSLTKQVQLLRENVSHDVFSKPYLGDFWDIRKDTKKYCYLRMRLIGALFQESKMRVQCDGSGRVNELALYIVLEHMKDLITAETFDHLGVRTLAPCVMIALGLYDEAYNFLKFWFIEDECEDDEESFGRSRWAVLMYRHQNVAEPLERFPRFNSRLSEQQFLDMALVKLCIFSEIRAAQILSQAFDVNDEILAMVTDMTNVPKSKNWREVDSSALLSQARQLLTCVHEKNKQILPGLIDPKKSLIMNSRNSQPLSLEPEYEEAAFVLHQIIHIWSRHPVAMNFVSNFVKDIEGSRLPIVRSKE